MTSMRAGRCRCVARRPPPNARRTTDTITAASSEASISVSGSGSDWVTRPPDESVSAPCVSGSLQARTPSRLLMQPDVSRASCARPLGEVRSDGVGAGPCQQSAPEAEPVDSSPSPSGRARRALLPSAQCAGLPLPAACFSSSTAWHTGSLEASGGVPSPACLALRLAPHVHPAVRTHHASQAVHLHQGWEREGHSATEYLAQARAQSQWSRANAISVKASSAFVPASLWQAATGDVITLAATLAANALSDTCASLARKNSIPDALCLAASCGPLTGSDSVLSVQLAGSTQLCAAVVGGGVALTRAFCCSRDTFCASGGVRAWSRPGLSASALGELLAATDADGRASGSAVEANASLELRPAVCKSSASVSSTGLLSMGTRIGRAGLCSDARSPFVPIVAGISSGRASGHLLRTYAMNLETYNSCMDAGVESLSAGMDAAHLQPRLVMARTCRLTVPAAGGI